MIATIAWDWCKEGHCRKGLKILGPLSWSPRKLRLLLLSKKSTAPSPDIAAETGIDHGLLLL